MNDSSQDIGLERATVLVVEDDLPIRSLLAAILSGLGVGKVLRASNGYRAIELMKAMRHAPESVGATEIDLVIADWMMEPVDGAALLRWLRRNRESPDRFMPFIMISGYRSQEHVTAARDLGAHQFIAKPFSINTLAMQIQAVAGDDRGFVKTGDYFGPDRRRREESVEVDRRAADSAAGKGVRFLAPVNRLKHKTGGDLAIDPERIAEAERDLETWHESYLDWLSDYLGRIEAAHGEAAATSDGRARRLSMDRINGVCHELRGQGGLFGYPLISTVSRSLFQLTHRITEVSDDCLKLVGEHLKTMKAIRRDDVKNDGGDLGRELVEALQAANRDFIAKSRNKDLVSEDFQRQARSGLAG
jgi:DNA-binding response OmpR family regulator